MKGGQIDMETIVQVVESVGFPIATAVASGIFIYKTQQQTREDYNKREERMFEQLDKFGESMDKFNETLIKIDERLYDLENKIKSE